MCEKFELFSRLLSVSPNIQHNFGPSSAEKAYHENGIRIFCSSSSAVPLSTITTARRSSISSAQQRCTFPSVGVAANILMFCLLLLRLLHLHLLFLHIIRSALLQREVPSTISSIIPAMLLMIGQLPPVSTLAQQLRLMRRLLLSPEWLPIGLSVIINIRYQQSVCAILLVVCMRCFCRCDAHFWCDGILLK